jgi:L-arabinose isomerase
MEANASPACVGVITWMHTFSPAKMWIRGLAQLAKPLAHLHTQYNRELPWSQIDMDFMNLKQSAHGDREFGFVAARLRNTQDRVPASFDVEDGHRRRAVCCGGTDLCEVCPRSFADRVGGASARP